MELKSEFIKSTISYISGTSFSYLINIPDYSDNESILKYIVKIINKEITKPISICFLSDNINNFNAIFPNFQNNIKLGSKYAIGHHQLTFNILDKKFIKTNDESFDIFIIFPYEHIKAKYIIKSIDSMPNLKKLIIIGKNLDKTKFPYELKSMVHTEFSFVQSHANAYYKFFNSRLSDMK